MTIFKVRRVTVEVGLVVIWLTLATWALSIPALSAVGNPSSDALIVLTTIGYLTGAADGCKVAAKESSALNGGMAIAIRGGKYGDPGTAYTLLDSAREKGVSAAAAGKADCRKVGEQVRSYVQSLGVR